MSKTQISQETGSDKQSPAEGATNETSPITTAGAPKDSRANRSSKRKDKRKAPKKPRRAKPAEENATGTLDPVPSVAELTFSICSNPEKRRKRLKVAEALRECGMDESRFAVTCFALTEKLSRNAEAGAVGVANAKLLLDVLKEVAHSLEPQKTAAANESSDVPQFVRLIHNVPRPVRTE